MTDRTERTKFFADLGWGVFTHYIGYTPSEGELRSHFLPHHSWDERVNRFNTDTYARCLHDVGAHYAFFTVMQGDKLCAPNETFDRICGTKPGEMCSSRDLIADLIVSLDKYDIPLFLYYTGDGPYKNVHCGRKMGYQDRDHGNLVDLSYVKNWTSVLREYAVRYGSKVKGWWVDGCYDYLGYTDDEYFRYYREAVLAGNPEAIIAFNDGTQQPDLNAPAVQKYLTGITHPMEKLRALEAVGMDDPEVVKALTRDLTSTHRYSEYEDYRAGECNHFADYPPEGGMVEGSRWHRLSFLGQHTGADPIWGGTGWDQLGSKYSGEELREYVKACNARGGVVSIDVYLFDDGSIDKGQLEVLKQIDK